ncbi:hypothetical protein KQ096_000941 [Salmonella enterica]|nr:hypothetical protein [Salmonella enterica]
MRYILFILISIGGLLSFSSYSRGLSDEPLGLNYSKPVSSCSASAPSVTGSFTIYVSGGRVHTNIDGCDYILPSSSPVPQFTPLPDGSSSVSFDFTFYPTGNVENADIKAGPVSSFEPDKDTVDKINNQTQRYCAQPGKCEPDEDGQGMYPKDDNDFIDFVNKDDAAHNNPSEKPGDKPSDKPGSGSSGETGGTSGTSSGSSAPSPSSPEKPYPDNAGASQLSDLLLSCQMNVNNLGFDISDAAFNAQAKSCNDILHRLSSVLASGEINSPSHGNQEFLTRNDAGSVFYCHITTQAERQAMINRGYPPSMVPEVNGTRALGVKYRDSEHLNFTFGSDYSDGGYCNSVYQDYKSSLNESSDSGNKPSYNTDGSSGSSSCPANQFYDPRSRQCLDYSVFHCGDGSEPVFSGSDYPLCEKHSTGSSGVVPVMPGNGHTDSGDGDNGDVVAAINAFHADANKNHQETIDTFTNLPQETPDLIEGYLSPKLNSIIDSMKKEMTDGYNDALAEFKGVFGDIDSYIPDIKLSFDLPVQFTSGIRGRCVPLVFDFNITLVGFQPYHFHAEGVQACQLYDTYIRSIVEYMLYFLTALACRRVFIRAAEFITSQP